MEYKKRTLCSKYDGHPLSLLEVVPKKARGVVQLVHGMSEYKERYLPFMEYLAKRGFVCVIHDHRGHGESIRTGKDYGYMYGGGGESLLADILQVNTLIRKQWQGLPLILFGHSMGSLAVRAFARDHDDCMDMLIVCGSPSKNPALKVGKAIAGAQAKIFGSRHPSKFIEALSFGVYALRFRQEKNRNAWICSNPEVIREYRESNICGFTFTADGYQALFRLMELTYGKEGWGMKQKNLPILFLSGADDPCLGNMRKFAQAVQHMRLLGYTDVKGKLYPGMRHEILNETDKERVFRDVYVYIRKKLYPEEPKQEYSQKD